MRSFFTTSALLALAALGLAAPLEERQATCTNPSTTFSSTAKLPNPFKKADGTAVTTLADWTCRQQEISALFQTTELGALPGKPTSVSATLSGNKITVSVTDNGKSISFSATINKPSSGSAPYPFIITIGGSSIPIPNTVGTIAFDNDGMGSQASSGSRGQGLFYNLYGSSHSAGALMAWAWGVGRLIDGLELTAATNNVDLKRLGVTGCSRNGKGAFVVGAFNPRIALTIPQESGSGGAACWRISDSQHAAGKNIQTAGEIIGENVWFSKNFNPFATATSTLPVDHHMLAGLVAPRGLFVIENDIDWLGPVSTTGCMKVGRLIYKAVGAPDAMGFTLQGSHNHCQFPSNQQADLTSFINKYLLNQSVSTANIEKSTTSANAADYIDWTAPTLT
jgi:hypothetical protein